MEMEEKREMVSNSKEKSIKLYCSDLAIFGKDEAMGVRWRRPAARHLRKENAATGIERGKIGEIQLQEAAILHYTYAKFSDLTSRRDRCKCKPTKEDLDRCFMLEFDRLAFIIASSGNEQEMRRWYEDHVVWGNVELKIKLLEKGLLTRIYTPMVIIQALRESGVFASVIASAATNLPKDQRSFSPNSSFVSQTPTRKLLEASDILQPQEEAIPPLPPPVLHLRL